MISLSYNVNCAHTDYTFDNRLFYHHSHFYLINQNHMTVFDNIILFG